MTEGPGAPAKRPYDCIVLAAGASRRMGRPKLYLSFGDRTLIETTVGNALGAGARVIVVARAGEERLAELLARDAEIVVNPDPERGMVSSLREALSLVSAERFFFIPADMPLVGSGVYRAMAALGAEGPVIPRARGRSGHPVLLPSSLIPAIMALSEGRTLKGLIAESGATYLDLGDDSVLVDIDTAADYEAAAARRYLYSSR
ncbi:MAG TPA: nucleotidyltransferase family protein [Rectinemataceae bacterium]|nr:nucleotidyltransferase family protein [Rectinemataceae bacterium]